MADDHGKHHHSLRSLKDRFRSRSNAAEQRPANTEQNVNDFLRSSNSVRRPAPPLAPRIDIAAAQRWQGNSADLRSGNGMATPSSLRGRGGSQKKARAPNLKVAFFDGPIEIIGEGGDECEDPTAVISQARMTKGSGSMRRNPHGVPEALSGAPRSRPSHTPPPGSRPQDPRDAQLQAGYGPKPTMNDGAADAYRKLFGEDPEPPPPRSVPDDDDFVPKPMKRTQTGFSSISATDSRNRGDSLSSMYSDDDGSGGSPPPPTSRAPQLPNAYKLPELDNLFESTSLDFDKAFGKPQRTDTSEGRSPIEMNNKIQRMRQEEGRVLHQNARRSIIDLADENVSAPPATAGAQPTLPQSGYDSDDIYGMYGSDTPPRSKSQYQSPEKTQNSYRSPEKPQNQYHSPEKPRVQQPPSNRYPEGLDREPRLPVLAGSYEAPSAPVSTPSPLQNAATPDVRNPQTLPLRKPVPPGMTVPAALMSNQGPSPKPTPSPLTIPNTEHGHHNRMSSELQSGVSTHSNMSMYRTPATATSVRTPGSAFSQAAYEDFGQRCSHMKGIFKLQADFEKPMSEYTPRQWLRAAAWWFAKGRNGMEILIRSRPKSADGPGSAKPQELLSQPHVDLAKVWWILSEVLPNHRSLPPPAHPEASFTARASMAASQHDTAAEEIFEGCDILQSNLRGLLSSMNKNNAMPPHNALIQGQDQTIWIPYPTVAPDILPILSGNPNRSLTGQSAAQPFDPMSVMAIADTKKDFAYYRWFVKASLSADNQTEQMSLLCLFSVMRTRNEWHPKVAICTQKELLTICVTGERKIGPSWEDVKWSEQDSSLQVRLPHGYILNAQLSPADYRIVAGLYKKAFMVQSSLIPREDEHVAFETTLADFQYSDTMRPPAFPLDRIRRCRVKLLIQTETVQEGAGARRFYRGMRILVTTSPKSRNLASASHELVAGEPIIMEMVNESSPGGENFPAMMLHIDEVHRQCGLYMIFANARERQMLYSAFNQADIEKEEMAFASLRLKKLSVESLGDFEFKGPPNPLGRMQWQELSVINGDPQNPDDDFGQTVLSSNLRIIASGAGGTVTDRINIGPGEFRLRMAPDGTPTMAIFRDPQMDMTITVDRKVAPFTTDSIDEMQEAIRTMPTKRTFTFFNLTDLHTFLFATTGFNVKFDGLARSFTISRRRPVTALSKHKKLEAMLTRVMVVSHDNDRVVQLLAFFGNEVTWAESLGIVLKGVDTFETFEGGKHAGPARCGVRIVDAKFSLPKEKGKKMGAEELDRPYVCLDMPVYAAENDDVWIGFDDPAGKFLFAM